MKRPLVIAVAVVALLADQRRRRALAQRRHRRARAGRRAAARADARRRRTRCCAASTTAATRPASRPAAPTRGGCAARATIKIALYSVGHGARAALADEADARRLVHARPARRPCSASSSGAAATCSPGCPLACCASAPRSAASPAARSGSTTRTAGRVAAPRRRCAPPACSQSRSPCSAPPSRARRRRSRPTASRAARSTRTAPTTATCSAATGCFASTRPESASSSAFSARRRPTAGRSTTVPNAWNAGDDSVASMTGTTGWYRKDFHLPDRRARMDWLVRFESVNYRSTVWLNGTPIGRNTGAYLPWDLRLPRSLLKRQGLNRLVVRVDNRRLRTDFPPSGLTGSGDPAGGWWNYGGLLREVYLQRVDKIDITSMLVRPDLPCATCDATVLARIVVRNYGNDSQPRAHHRELRSASKLALGTRAIGSKDFATFDARIKVRNPRLWSPAEPAAVRRELHRPRGRSQGPGLHAAQRHPLDQGRRRAPAAQRPPAERPRRRAPRGRPGRRASRSTAPAARRSSRRPRSSARRSSARTIRCIPRCTSSPTATGLLIWSEIPVYSVKTQYLKRLAVRKLAARELEDNINANQNHPSIMLWSIGNELSARPGPGPAELHRARGASGQGAGPVAPDRRSPSPATRRPAAGRSTRRSTSSAQRLLRLVPGPQRPDRRPRRALGLPRRDARLLSEQGDLGLGVRRRGQPRRARSRRRAPTSSSRTS